MASVNFEGTVHATELDPDEIRGLKPSLSTQQELNQFEYQNILEAARWAFSARELEKCQPCTEPYVRELHRRMFSETWKWAGQYRKGQKSLGVPHHQIREQLPALLGDAKYWVEHNTFPIDEIGVRLHHRLVQIHPFSNGNGRHARMLADVLVMKLGSPRFSWGSIILVEASSTRETYINCLRDADNGNLQNLIAFSRS